MISISDIKMDEDILLSKDSKIDLKTNNKVDTNKYIDIIEKKLEIASSEPLCPESNTVGPDDKTKLCISVKADDQSMDESTNDVGGRLTFFIEGKPLLELSHRTEQGSWVQVKSKTYWPPSTTAKTTTQLKNGSSLWCTDECSNNSSAFSDHLRKQNSPKRSRYLTANIYWHSKKSSKLRGFKGRRHPFAVLYSKSCEKSLKYRKRKKPTLRETIHCICEKIGCNIENNQTINTLCEGWRSYSHKTNVGQSPRKRLLKCINGEKDSHSKRKHYSSLAHSSHKSCDGAAGSSTQITNKGISSYSIDSLLNNDFNRNESFLHNLLKSDLKETQTGVRNHSIQETQRNLKHHNWFESNNSSDGRSSKSIPPEYNNVMKATPALNNYYLNYLNTGYMAMPQYYPAAQPTAEMASMVAAAMNLQGMQNSPILSSASLEADYRVANLHSPQSKTHSLRSPQSRLVRMGSPNSHQQITHNHGRESPQPRPIIHSSSNSPQPRAFSLSYPHSISPSPNSKHLANMSSYIGLLNGPPLAWPASTSTSPPSLSTSVVSHPPQDVPLNLSKRKEKR